ncbi:MAG TPA: hypothetical protein VK034_08725 [Enhygromyxa sp.]|nr:hypothetical protein [Enhygromyxa sp.]
MSETVRVDLRQATLSENARLREAGERLFLALENPPPVRSLLRLISGDEQKAFEVVRVIEVVDDDESARGCYGRYVDIERLAEQIKVGSEHLEPGIRSGGGVPAPVVIMNSGELLLGEAGEESEQLAAGDGDASEDEGEGESSESSEGEASEPTDDN